MKATAEVLGMDVFDESIFAWKIDAILVQGANTLAFVFKDGHIVNNDWSDRSRAASWTDEMREAARQRAKERSSAV
jgi:outer membrane protease